MNNITKGILSTVLAFMPVAHTAQLAPELESAQQLVARVTPQYAGRVKFSIAPQQSAPTIVGRGKSILIQAPNVRECIRAYGYYLRHIAKVHFSWNANNTTGASYVVPSRQITVPQALPFNYAYNYCTLSYTAAAWDKARWERELDLLALNGVRYVLVTSGLEKVWQNFLTDLDYPAEKTRKFIAAPAYAAWWHMGNLEGEGGPVSQSLIESEAELGRFIVHRLKELGMEPVLQGYVGFLPHDYPKAGLDGKILPQGKWCGYMRPAVLQPTAPAFAGIAELWYKHLHKVYGTTAHAYGGDLFHEGGKKADTQLDEAARAVQKAMQKASPGSTWLLQAWGHNPDKQLLAGTDPKHTVILALQKDLTPKAQVNFNYSGRPFVWCELSNFGGKHGMFGGMDVIENMTRAKSKAIGLGMISEGLETSPFFYELFWTRLGTPGKIDRTAYIQRYTKSRYGSNDPQLHNALNLLAGSIFTPDKRREGSLENIICARPDLNAKKASTWADPTMYYQPQIIEQAASLYLKAGLKAGNKLTSLPTYRHDLADLCRQVLADRARAALARCKNAYDNKDIPAFKRESEAFLNLIRSSAAVLATSEHFLLGRFLEGARNRGTTEQDKASLEQSLRRLITTWRPDIGVLNDYSHRQFSEMMQYYYLPRWQIYFEECLEQLNGTPSANHHTVREITHNNGEAVEHITTKNRKLQNFELAFPRADIPLLLKPQGNLTKLASKLLRPTPTKK